MDQNLFTVGLSGQSISVHAGSAHRDHRYLWRSDRHCHGEYELHLLLSGHVRMEVGKENFALTSQTGLLIPPGQYHSPLAEGPLERLSLRLSVPGGGLLDAKDCRMFDLPEELCRVCRAYFYETSAANPYRREARKALLTQLIIGVLRSLGAEQSPGKQEENVSSMERMAFIDDYFEKHFAGGGGKEELARQLYLSPRQLARLLQKEYGMGYQEKLLGARMDCAAKLLRTTKLPISRIAEQVGYQSEPAFFKAFARHYGMTPHTYRKENKESKEETP